MEKEHDSMKDDSQAARFVLLSDRLAFGMKRRQSITGKSVNMSDCADAADCSRSAVSLWFKNETGISSKYARPLAAFFDVDPEWLETGRGYPEREKSAVAALQSEQILSEQLQTLIRAFFQASPMGRDQILDFASSADRPPPEAPAPPISALPVSAA